MSRSEKMDENIYMTDSDRIASEAMRLKAGAQATKARKRRGAPQQLAFHYVRKNDLIKLYETFQLSRPEPVFVDIYAPTLFQTPEEFVDYFSDDMGLWTLGPVSAPSAYFALHDFQLEHDLANLDFTFFCQYPAVGSEKACLFWEYVQACAAKSGLTRLQSFMLVSSVEKIALIESFGFRKEGILREHYFHDGRLHDVAVHAWMTEERRG